MPNLDTPIKSIPGIFRFLSFVVLFCIPLYSDCLYFIVFSDVAFKASKMIDLDGMAKMIVSGEAHYEFSSLFHAFDKVNSALRTKLPVSEKYREVYEILENYISLQHAFSRDPWISVKLNVIFWMRTQKSLDFQKKYRDLLNFRNFRYLQEGHQNVCGEFDPSSTESEVLLPALSKLQWL